MDKVKEENGEQKQLKSSYVVVLRQGNTEHDSSSLVLHCQGSECTDGMSVATTMNDNACDENVIQPNVAMNGEIFNNNVCFVDLSLVEQDSGTLRSTHKKCCTKSCKRENVPKEESHKNDRECESDSNIELNGHRDVICVVTEEEHSQSVICAECQKLQETMAEDKRGTKHRNSYEFTSSCNEIGQILNGRLDPVIDSIPLMNGDFSGEEYDPMIQASELHSHPVIQNGHSSMAWTRGHDAVLPLEDNVDNFSNSDSLSGDESESDGASDLTCSRKLDYTSSGQPVVRPKTGSWHQQSSQKSCKNLKNHQNSILNGHKSLTWETVSDPYDGNKLIDPIKNSLGIQDCFYDRLDGSVPEVHFVGRSSERSFRPLVVPPEQRARDPTSYTCALDSRCAVPLLSAHQSLVLSLNRNCPNYCTCSMCTHLCAHCNSSVISDSQIVTENKDSSPLAPLALPERDIDSDSDNSCDMYMGSEENSPSFLSVSENASYLPCEGIQSSQNDNTAECSEDNDIQTVEDLQNQTVQSNHSEEVSENMAEVQYACETINSKSSSLESIEDVGDYIETDFPSANRFAMSGDSSSTSSVEEDEGCGSDVAPANNEESDNETIDPLSNQVPESDDGPSGFAHESHSSKMAIFGHSPDVNSSDIGVYNSSTHESHKQIQPMRPNIIETKCATCTPSKKRECVQSRQQSFVSSGSNDSSIVSPGDELEHHLCSSSEVHSTGSAGIPSASSSSSAQSQNVFHFDREFSPPDQVFLDNSVDHSSENVPINYENFKFFHHYHEGHMEELENSHLVNRTLEDNLLGEAIGGYDDDDDLRGMERRNNLSLGGSSVDSYGSHMSTPSLYLSNFQNDSSNQQEKVFEKLSLEQPFHLACSSDEEENNSHSEQRHGVEEYLRTEESWGFVQCIDGSDDIHVDLTQRFGPYTSAPLCGDASPRKIQIPECIQENSMIVRDEPIYEEIDDMDLEMYQAADREDLGISKDNLDSKMCNNVPNKKPQGKFGKARRRPQQSDIEKVMIWNEYEAYVLQVKQIGTSACGPTAVLNILKAFDFQVDKDEVCQAIATNTRMEAAPIPYYIFSRSVAGTTSETLLEGIEKLTRGAIKGRFFHFYPPRDVQLLKWLGNWIKKGAVPIATLNLQRGVKPGWTIPDAWHHQMIYGVSSKGVYLTNPLEIVCEEIIMEQLTSDSVLLIRRQDIVNRFRDWCPLNEILKQKDPRWRIMNVLGQVANVLRENCSPLNHAAGFRPQLTSHISIPAVYKAGITLFMRSNADAFEELMSAPELPIKQSPPKSV